MASPQTEKGYTRIANEILEKIMETNLNGTQFRIVLALWRFTYGFKRKEYGMSIAFIAKLTSASKGQVDRELTSLIEDRKIINVIGIGSKGARIMSFNKNYEEWQERPLSKTKDNDIPPKKEAAKKRTRKPKKYDENNTYYKMAVYFLEKVTPVAKDAGVEHLIAKANMQSWADDFRKLVEIDKVKDKKQIVALMDWVTTHDFWKTNVLSAKKFREKFGELAIKMKASQSPKQPQKEQNRVDPRDREIAFSKWVTDGGDPADFVYKG